MSTVMKIIFPWLLGASLLLNAVITWRYLAVRASGEAAAAPAAPAVPPPKSTAASDGAAPAVDAKTWSKLDAADLPTLAKNLRAAGFPPEFIRALVLNQVNEALASRRAALDAMLANDGFWKTGALTPEARAMQQQFTADRVKLMRDALGPDAAEKDPVDALNDERRLAGIPAEKVNELRRLERLDEERRQEIGRNVTGPQAPEVLAAFKAREAEQRAALARLLTPSELFEYDLRNSRSARSLSDRLLAVNLTEAEFRTLFPLQQAFDQQVRAVTTAQNLQAFNEAQRQLVEQIKAALGPARAADFDRAMNSDYASASRYVAGVELPPQAAGQIWAVQQDIEARASAVRTNAALSPDARAAQLNALVQEATAKLTPILGSARGVETYKQYGSRWLQGLARPPPAPAPKN